MRSTSIVQKAKIRQVFNQEMKYWLGCCLSLALVSTFAVLILNSMTLNLSPDKAQKKMVDPSSMKPQPPSSRNGSNYRSITV